MEFLGTQHETRFNELKAKAQIQYDVERLPVMYILAGNSDLYRKASKIYNFEKGNFNVDIDEDGKVQFDVDLSSGTRALALLAFDLYSANNTQGVYSTFNSLDEANSILAINAIKLRFRI